MQITKIKHDPKKPEIVIRYTDTPDVLADEDAPLAPAEADRPAPLAAPDRHEVTSEQVPHPDLVQALGALDLAFVDVCEMDPDWVDELSVRGLTISYNADGDMRAMVTATRTVGIDHDLTMVVNTPLFEPHGLLVRLIETACQEARRYVRGKRAQADLFDAVNDPDSGITSIEITDGQGNGARFTATGSEVLTGTLSGDGQSGPVPVPSEG